jgi:hypothetical protein
MMARPQHRGETIPVDREPARRASARPASRRAVQRYVDGERCDWCGRAEDRLAVVGPAGGTLVFCAQCAPWYFKGGSDV